MTLYLAALAAVVALGALLVGRFIRAGEGPDLPHHSIRGGGVFMDRSGR